MNLLKGWIPHNTLEGISNTALPHSQPSQHHVDPESRQRKRKQAEDFAPTEFQNPPKQYPSSPVIGSAKKAKVANRRIDSDAEKESLEGQERTMRKVESSNEKNHASRKHHEMSAQPRGAVQSQMTQE